VGTELKPRLLEVSQLLWVLALSLLQAFLGFEVARLRRCLRLRWGLLQSHMAAYRLCEAIDLHPHRIQ